MLASHDPESGSEQVSERPCCRKQGGPSRDAQQSLIREGDFFICVDHCMVSSVWRRKRTFISTDKLPSLLTRTRFSMSSFMMGGRVWEWVHDVRPLL